MALFLLPFNAYADNYNMALVDLGRKDAVVSDLSTLKAIGKSRIQAWTYLVYANPQIDGDGYYLTAYQLEEFDCLSDRYRTIEVHTYDLGDRETGTPYYNGSVDLINVVPGTLAQATEKVVCHPADMSNVMIKTSLSAFRKSYYQALHDDKIK